MIDEYREFADEFRILTEIDLSYYNQPQILRRLTAFQQKLHFGSLLDLLAALKSDPVLLRECLDRLTINVTEFFRDRDYWQVFKDNVSLLAKKKLPLRFWSAGCASGEEPYSLAFMLINMLPRTCWEITASDLSNRALTAAKTGIYLEKALKNLNPAEIALIFDPVEGEMYQVKNRLRQCITFFHHNLLFDPYPPNLDVVLCRNVIIYFTEKAKKRVFSRLAQALNPGGLLFVGGSEQIITPEVFGLEREDVYIYRKAN
ncbi:MAG: protein-glutamate O-methyltransferase CheR [Eubacteriales bacterium]|nr:protein-glutamate O-methyltransferase CheR [Eubacteriales bacterium]MDD3073907.1 protein-glutamate O-methyltransferase CheR [Eubacteriales bacterium]MDD4769816.1 protein-glutamate O-methyltransferase CheR [Eubacteriales bacterium]